MAKQAINIDTDSRSTSFVHTDDVNTSIRFTRKLSDKNIDGVTVPNLRSEIILNMANPVHVCENTCAGTEVLSARASFSGSIKNAADMDLMCDELIAAIQAFKSARGTKGFPVSDYEFVALHQG